MAAGGGGRHYLSEPHAVPLVGRLLCLGRVHQLEAGLVLLVEVGVVAPTAELGGVLVWRGEEPTPVSQSPRRPTHTTITACLHVHCVPRANQEPSTNHH